MRVNSVAESVQSKALTDISMPRDMGVEVNFVTASTDGKKRLAATSPPDTTGTWNLKHSKTVSSNSTTDEEMTPVTDDRNELQSSMVRDADEHDTIRVG